MLNLNNQYVVINGRDSRDFGIYVIDGNIFDFAVRDFETYQVPGRTGDLTFDHGRWKNITLTLKCAALDNGREKLEAWRAFLLSGMNAKWDDGNILGGYYGTYKIELSMEPDIYRVGTLKSASSPQISLADGGGYVEISFDCSPKKFLKSGEEEVLQISMRNVPFYNPTYYDAKPLIKVSGYNNPYSVDITNTIYNEMDYSIYFREEFTINIYTTEEIIIDCETRNVTKASDGSNYNNYVSITGGDDFPRFIGKSALPQTLTRSQFYAGTGVGISIYPKWWTL